MKTIYHTSEIGFYCVDVNKLGFYCVHQCDKVSLLIFPAQCLIFPMNGEFCVEYAAFSPYLFDITGCGS